MATVFVVGPLSISPAFADDDETNAARALYLAGKSKFEEGRFDEALVLARRSLEQVESPNTMSLAARCLAELGRKEEALAMFDAVETTAAARMAAGDDKYEPTRTQSAELALPLRRELGVVRVHIANAPAGAIASAGRMSAPLVGGTARLYVEPGQTRLRITTGATVLTEQTVVVAAGKPTDVSIGDAPSDGANGAPITPSPSAPDTSSSGPLLPVGITLGILGASGLAMFAGFGASSDATYRKLEEECGGRCGEDRRDEANQGATFQTIANVSLGLGLASAVAGGTLIAIHFATADDAAKSPQSRVQLVASPTGAAVRGTFD
ncbi:MAG: hypothetical protein HOW73_48390 [Polyangiaceae bacterium]|nr:hypothetical protein [Polyangiaceae bacterium]